MDGYKILLIDDEQSIVNSLNRVLRDAEYGIVTANNAEEAMPIVEREKVDMIICDYKLGGMNGIDFLHKVSEKYPRIINILLTGKADLDMAIDAINRTAIHKFIVKPWDNQELRKLVKSELTERYSQKLTQVKAGQIMSKFAITIKEGLSLFRASHLMRRFRVSGMPVVSKDGKLIGIITATDLFRIMGEQITKKAKEGRGQPEKYTVESVMSKDVHTISEQTDLFEIIGIMYKKNIHTLPVVRGSDIVGIIGRRDVINKYYNLFSEFE